MSIIRTFFRHCPSCGRRFEVRLVEKKELGEESRVEEKSVQAVRASGPTPGAIRGSVPIRYHVVNEYSPLLLEEREFQYSYECSHCGHKWSELREEREEQGAPRDYTGD